MLTNRAWKILYFHVPTDTGYLRTSHVRQPFRSPALSVNLCGFHGGAGCLGQLDFLLISHLCPFPWVSKNIPYIKKHINICYMKLTGLFHRMVSGFVPAPERLPSLVGTHRRRISGRGGVSRAQGLSGASSPVHSAAEPLRSFRYCFI